MPLSFSSIDEQAARDIISWRYDPPYEMYNYRPEDLEKEVVYLCDPRNGVFLICDEEGRRIAFCSFGADAQVPGWDYGPEALDVGLGLRPEYTGRSLGAGIIGEVLRFAAGRFHPAQFRVTIAAFNLRARKAWTKAGFAEVGGFSRKPDGLEFVVLIGKPLGVGRGGAA